MKNLQVKEAIKTEILYQPMEALHIKTCGIQQRHNLERNQQLQMHFC